MKIVADSSCDLSPELKEKLDVTLVPLTIRVGEKKLSRRWELKSRWNDERYKSSW